MYIYLFHFYDKSVCNDFFSVNKISVCRSVCHAPEMQIDTVMHREGLKCYIYFISRLNHILGGMKYKCLVPNQTDMGNCHPLEVLCRGSETQVCEYLNKIASG